MTLLTETERKKFAAWCMQEADAAAALYEATHDLPAKRNPNAVDKITFLTATAMYLTKEN